MQIKLTWVQLLHLPLLWHSAMRHVVAHHCQRIRCSSFPLIFAFLTCCCLYTREVYLQTI